MTPVAATPASAARRARSAATTADAAWSPPRNVRIRNRDEAAAAVRWIGLFAAALVVVGLGHALLSARTRELDYDRMAALQVVRRLEREGRDLEAKVESLNRHDRIERIARDQLGMVRPAAGQKRVLP